MQLQVLLFGAERKAAGRDRAVVSLTGSRTCLDLRERLAAEVPALAPHLASARFAVNGAFVPLSHTLDERDEVALIGPVSGG
jgi:molybdopterin converting factor small subunit